VPPHKTYPIYREHEVGSRLFASVGFEVAGVTAGLPASMLIMCTRLMPTYRPSEGRGKIGSIVSRRE
jgi:hypothetical protein